MHHSWKGLTKKLRHWENEDIATLATYYEENNFVTNEEKQLDIQQWSFFWQIVLQRKHKKKYIEIYQEILKENSEDAKGMALLLTKMMTSSGSKRTCNQGFSCMNSQKIDLRTWTAEKANNIMVLSISDPSVDGFDTSPHIMSWLNNSNETGKRRKYKQIWKFINKFCFLNSWLLGNVIYFVML